MTQDSPTTTPAEQLNATCRGSFIELIGLHFTELSPDRAVGTWTVTPQLHQPTGIQHGGVLCSVVETLASVAGQAWYGSRGVVVGVNNNTDFLRSVSAGTLTGVATPVHRGRSGQLWQVVLTDTEDRLISRGQVRLQNLPARE